MEVSLEHRPDAEYDEDAFLYFLNVERSRADRSNDGLGLLLVSVEPVPGRPAPIGRAAAVRLFTGLSDCLRDTDVLGWYRQDRMAGAVLSAPAGEPASELSHTISQRVAEKLRLRLPLAAARHLRVRMVRLRRPLEPR